VHMRTKAATEMLRFFYFLLMVDKQTTIKLFVSNFIQKEKRERCLGELTNPKKRCKFTDKLNHKWRSVIDMQRLELIDTSFDNKEAIQKLLGFLTDQLCYIISDHPDFDDQYLPFEVAFNNLYAQGHGTIILNSSADTLFLNTEEMATRFIGRS
jgi:hypothetical protein